MPVKSTENVDGRERQLILVVDDFDDTRLMMKLWLEKKGFQVVEAAHGKDAIAVAGRESPDLIIMDIEMPELNGLEATRRIRLNEKLREVPIVAVSAYGAEQFRAEALEAGCDEYVSTPFEPVSLEKLLVSLLSRSVSRSSPGN
jgi:CheY-like chemotaxis protein